MDSVLALTFTPLSQPTMQTATHIKMKIPPDAMELVPLQCGINRLFEGPVSLSSFLNTCIPLRKLHQMIFNLHHVFVCLGLGNKGQISVEELLQTILGFGRRMQEG